MSGAVSEEPAGLRRLRIEKPKGNVLDSLLCAELRAELGRLVDDEARLVVVEGAGPHFSFGASIEEHLPAGAAEMLRALHDLVEALASCPVPTLAAVRGHCLGGGLEVALACDLVFVEESTVLATPEIRLGVFAPSATALLLSAVPRAAAAEILLSGRDISAEEAVRWGLANRMVQDGRLEGTVEKFAAEHFAPRSPASLRVATRAYRAFARQDLHRRLGTMEELYLQDLLDLHDGTEGIQAFLEKRAPSWRNA